MPFPISSYMPFGGMEGTGGPLGYLYGKEMTAPLPKQLQEICDGLFGRAE